ncbi:hypothetical protein KR032_008283, partial [Drosophila birchii]
VTRARTRRMSLLDTDSRPGTPQLDTASDRGTASPRPTRRTRLNSVTLDVRTPTRSTRASLARGETPEPVTPSSVKRTARTPAKSKSVRQQLTLKEEAEESEVEKPRSRTNTPTPTPSGEKRVTRSMSQTPPSVTRPSSQPDLLTFSEDKPKRELESAKKPQVVEKEAKAAPVSIKPHTPKVSVRLEKLKMDEQKRDGIVLAEEIKEKREATPVKPLVVKELNDDDNKQSVPTLEDSERSQIPVSSINNESEASLPTAEPTIVPDSPEPAESTVEKPSENPVEKQPEPASLPVRPPEKNDSLEEQEFLDAQESLPGDELQQNEPMSEMEQDSNVEPDITEPKVEEIKCEESPKHQEETIETQKKGTIETPKKELIASPEAEVKAPEIPMDIDEDIQVPNKEDSVIISSPNPPAGEQKKAVGFHNATKENDVEKKRFPKTPGREKMPSSLNLTPKPLKTDMDQRRNSSTPLLKSQESQLQPAPLKIDAIRPFDELEKEKEFSPMSQPANVSPKKAVSEILALLDSDEEEEEGDECEFIANEAEEAPAHYQSGDSMDSSERREIEENEIHCDGESVGSQDTEEESVDDSHESNDSFVVPDDDVEEDLDPLCYSTNEEDEEEEFLESKDKKKRRRILVAESSDDENQGSVQNTSKLAKAKERSNCSSDASKLSEAAQMLNGSAEKFSNSETELENSRIMALNELNKSERFNKTATRQDVSILELDSTDQEEEEEEEDQPAKRNTSVFEIMDSEDDKGPVDEGQDEDENEELEAGEGETKNEEAEEEKAEEEEAEEEQAEEEQEEPVEKSTTSFQTQKSSKSADEEALLAELASKDLRHLETMFNPLQKSRRQSLIMPGHELAAKEPKLKRRSDRAVVGSDFCPSQSFVEMVAEQKRIKNKRKRLSKSFTCATEDLEEMGEIHHERKRLKSSKMESTESFEDDDGINAVEHAAEKETSKQDSLQESDSEIEPMQQQQTNPEPSPEKEEVKNVAQNVSLKKSPAKETSLEDNSHSQEEGKPTMEPVEDKTIVTAKAAVSKAKLEPSSEPKTAEYYLEYCNNVLQKANEAFLKKKQEDVAAGKRQKKQKRPATSAAGKSEETMSVLTLQTGKQTSNPAATIQAGKPASKPPPAPPKKDLKRLQAARQAVGHAVSLLAPTKEPRSLARKLSPQPPPKDKKESKQLKKTKKQKLPETSPLKSSDEENHVVRGTNRFRTNAGFVTVSRIDSPPRAPIIELIKTSSGIMRVEPVTPKQKYFREVPATPRNHGFQEKPTSSKKRAKQKALQASANCKQNSAMQSALRFKEQAFARKF